MFLKTNIAFHYSSQRGQGPLPDCMLIDLKDFSENRFSMRGNGELFSAGYLLSKHRLLTRPVFRKNPITCFSLLRVNRILPVPAAENASANCPSIGVSPSTFFLFTVNLSPCRIMV